MYLYAKDNGLIEGMKTMVTTFIQLIVKMTEIKIILNTKKLLTHYPLTRIRSDRIPILNIFMYNQYTGRFTKPGLPRFFINNIHHIFKLILVIYGTTKNEMECIICAIVLTSIVRIYQLINLLISHQLDYRQNKVDRKILVSYLNYISYNLQGPQEWDNPELHIILHYSGSVIRLTPVTYFYKINKSSPNHISPYPNWTNCNCI
ncbi:hypothetical protein AGLY_010241 [Aphis glycines]|uniref:Uncharacterized protein n=1 Tax=Aphis glycines TaxID=307491 RepID=A0A6G0TFG2_APHGL|nr:hypothetical protein AGLY_010241 [Aphis glycines]